MRNLARAVSQRNGGLLLALGFFVIFGSTAHASSPARRDVNGLVLENLGRGLFRPAPAIGLETRGFSLRA